ncbi:MAG TPA: hypothetical protein VM030_00450 [Acidimicrobiales bacterium]|nr:hypothetical protein [Acidimicrobiales bacterium]
MVEPNRKTMLTAARTDHLARQLDVARVALVANRIGGAEDEARMRAFAAELGRDLVAVVPEDEAIDRADRSGQCVLDMAPDSPAVQALERLASDLEDHLIGCSPVSGGVKEA